MTEDQKRAYERSHWTIDRRVPLAIILAIFSQFGIGIWFVADLDNRTENNESKIEALEERNRENDVSRSGISARVIRIEEKMAAQTELLREIKRAVTGN